MGGARPHHSGRGKTRGNRAVESFHEEGKGITLFRETSRKGKRRVKSKLAFHAAVEESGRGGRGSKSYLLMKA